MSLIKQISTLQRSIISLALGLVILIPASASAGFSSFYQGVPDLVFSSLEQRDSETFRMVVCNQGDMSSSMGQLTVTLRSNEGDYEERTYKNVSIPSSKCQAFVIDAVDGYRSAAQRKTSITGTISWKGTRNELNTRNNKLTLAARKARADSTDPVSQDDMVSSDPVYDLWGSDTASQTWYQPTNYSYNTNTQYSNGSVYTNSTNPNYSNGDFSPAGPTYAMIHGTKNVIYVYRGPNDGYWYTYQNLPNGNTYYKPYENSNAIFSRETGYVGTTDTIQYYDNGSWNSHGSVVGNGSVTVYPSHNYYGCSYNGYTWNDSRCNDTDYRGQADLYTSNLRQNGGRSELIATVCNKGGKMTRSQTATIRISNGSYSTTRAFVSQLNEGGCTDVTIPFGSLQLNYPGRNYMLMADLDFYNNISETREDNNMSYWGVVIN